MPLKAGAKVPSPQSGNRPRGRNDPDFTANQIDGYMVIFAIG
jgi:hypothetical protein